jgi:hypothetical protein
LLSKARKEMDHFNNPGMSPARRRAESMIREAIEESELKKEQEKQRQAQAAKTEKLRELSLAKEAAEKDSKGAKPVRRQKRETTPRATLIKHRERVAR